MIKSGHWFEGIQLAGYWKENLQVVVTALAIYYQGIHDLDSARLSLEGWHNFGLYIENLVNI